MVGTRTLEIGKISLLVESSLGETERVDDINLLLRRVFNALLGLLSRSVGSSICETALGNRHAQGRKWRPTEGFVANGNLFTVGLVDYAIDLLEVVHVGDDLVVGEQVLRGVLAVCVERRAWSAARGMKCAANRAPWD
jgi:hypothetical protein